MEPLAVNKKHLNARACALIQKGEDIGENLIDLLKEVKSDREIAGMKECHIYDGAALVSFLAWLEDSVHV